MGIQSVYMHMHMSMSMSLYMYMSMSMYMYTYMYMYKYMYMYICICDFHQFSSSQTVKEPEDAKKHVVDLLIADPNLLEEAGEWKPFKSLLDKTVGDLRLL